MSGTNKAAMKRIGYFGEEGYATIGDMYHTKVKGEIPAVSTTAHAGMRLDSVSPLLLHSAKAASPPPSHAVRVALLACAAPVGEQICSGRPPDTWQEGASLGALLQRRDPPEIPSVTRAQGRGSLHGDPDGPERGWALSFAAPACAQKRCRGTRARSSRLTRASRTSTAWRTARSVSFPPPLLFSS